MNSYPQSKSEWQTAVSQGIGLTAEYGRSAYAAGQIPYEELQQWLENTYRDGYHPDFVPALIRNIIGLAAWLYGNSGEPNWSQSDEERQTYLEQLPKKRMGAGVLVMDENGRILLVQPSYKPNWEIPGGVVEKGESPRACCQREVQEELGIQLKIGQLLIIDYSSATDAKTESLMFIFDGHQISPSTIKKIKLHPEELISYRFFHPNQLPDAMTSSLKKRLLAAWNNKIHGGDSYTENQHHL